MTDLLMDVMTNPHGEAQSSNVRADPVDRIHDICIDAEGDKLTRIAAVLGYGDETSQPTFWECGNQFCGRVFLLKPKECPCGRGQLYGRNFSPIPAEKATSGVMSAVKPKCSCPDRDCPVHFYSGPQENGGGST